LTDLPARWDHGAPGEPPIQVHAIGPHTFVLRQNKAVHYEAPFLYLLCGNDRALLLDTGATTDPSSFPLRETVDRLLAEHCELVVAHTHGHGDHTAGDDQFRHRPNTRVIPADVPALCSYFGIADWPAQVVPFDLGGRILEITGIPGHHRTSIAVHDPRTGFLFTGDTVLPGRLYVQDMPAFQDSLRRLTDLARTRSVTGILGCHIEMTTSPGRDYPIGATYQPDEAPLLMTVAQLTQIRDVAEEVGERPGVHVRDDFVIHHGPVTSPSS
jgi:glyoxylase-like metal-dependent hydrolase (beta-lactamase superfamily II)